MRKQWPISRCELDRSNPLELLVAVILSAQCTDTRVNTVTKSLFKRYRTAHDYAHSSPAELESLIRTTGFFRSKAKSIRDACQAIDEKHGGRVPKTMEELTQLPGIGRKSANVILGTAYGITSGIVVDTHMTRLADRLKLSREKDPVKIERDLMKVVPKKDWIYFSQSMVLHGRYVCVARSPRCFACRLEPLCPYSEKARPAKTS